MEEDAWISSRLGFDRGIDPSLSKYRLQLEGVEGSLDRGRLT